MAFSKLMEAVLTFQNVLLIRSHVGEKQGDRGEDSETGMRWFRLEAMIKTNCKGKAFN